MDRLSELRLADPKFYKPNRISIILGVYSNEIYSQILRPGLRHFLKDKLIAQEAALGWVVSGPYYHTHEQARSFSRSHLTSIACEPGLHSVLQRFWVEEILKTQPNKIRTQTINSVRTFLYSLIACCQTGVIWFVYRSDLLLPTWRMRSDVQPSDHSRTDCDETLN